MWGRLVSAIALSLVLAGCSGYGELRSVVGDATPDSAERVGKCQEFGVYGVIDNAAYGCAFFVAGTRDGIALAVAESLVAQGFTARCREDAFDGTIEFHGERESIRAYGTVSRRGSVITMSNDQPLNIHRDTRFLQSDYRRAPRRHVIVKLGASRDGGEPLFANWSDCVSFLRGTR
jgi:hypothetical protein